MRSSMGSAIAMKVEAPRDVVSINGQVFDRRDCKIPLEDHGAMFGCNVFEGLRVIDGGILLHTPHRERLYHSAELLHIPMPPRGDYDQQLRAAIDASNQRDCYVRVIRTRGIGGLGIDPTPCGNPLLIFIVGAISLYPESAYQAGTKLYTSSIRKTPAACLDCTNIKHGNYLPNGEAKREALQRGADDALMLTTSGHVSEATVANIFAIAGDRLCTPDLGTNCLRGITRQVVMELAAVLGFVVDEGLYDREFFAAADAVFLTGTGTGILPVSQLDGRDVGTERGRTACASLRTAYEGKLRNLCE